MDDRRPRPVLGQIMLIIALCGLILGFVRAMGAGGGPSLTTFALFEVAFLVWFLAWQAVRGTRMARPCEGCGGPFVPARAGEGKSFCRGCQQRALSPAEWKKQQGKWLRNILFIVSVCALMFAAILWNPVGSHFRRGFWVALPLISLGGAAGLIAALVAGRVGLTVLRSRRSRREGYVLDSARASAGVPGGVERSGPVTAWSSAGGESLAMLLDQFENSRRGFTGLTGEPIEPTRPLRMLCFGRRGGFIAYHQRFGFEAGAMDGLYMQAPVRVITLSAEVLPYRLTDLERTVRLLSGYYWLEAYKGFPSPVWLQQGVTNLVAGGGPGNFTRLNRRMTLAIARGTTLPAADLFPVRTTALARLVRAWYDHAAFARLTRFTYQTCSVVEFLGGDRATADRRERFRAFLKAFGAGKAHEQDFQTHFGHGYDRLLDDWRVWVLDQGVGTHEPPPPWLRDALVNHLVPIIRDKDARVMDRIQAIRSMGQWGYVLGADALIELLRRGEPELPNEEIVWALEMISGQALGGDTERWEDWWEGVAARTAGVATG